MSLMHQAEELNERMSVIQQWKKEAQRATQAEYRRDDWAKAFGPIESLIVTLGWLGAKEMALTAASNDLSALKKYVEASLAILASDAGIDGLTKGTHWVKTQSTAKSLADKLQLFAESAWKKYLESKGSFQTPAAVGAPLTKTDANNLLLKRYAAEHTAYARLARQNAPQTAEDLEAAANLADSLRDVISQFSTDEPVEVRRFFAAIHAGQGASISLLTDTVRQWLDVRGEADNFIVKSR